MVLGCGGATADGSSGSLPLEFEQLSFLPPPTNRAQMSRPTDAPGLQGAVLVFNSRTASPDDKYTVRSRNTAIVPDGWATTFCNKDVLNGLECTVTVAAQTRELGRTTLDVIDRSGVVAGVIPLHVRRPSDLDVVVERTRDQSLQRVAQGTVTLGLGEEVALYPVPMDGSGALSVGHGGFRFVLSATEVVKADAIQSDVADSAPLRVRGLKPGEVEVVLATVSGVSTKVVVRVVR